MLRSIRSTGTLSTARASPLSFPVSQTSLKMARTAHGRSIPPRMSRTSYLTPARCVPPHPLSSVRADLILHHQRGIDVLVVRSSLSQLAGAKHAETDKIPQEIDTPGHTSAISKTYPQYVACAEATPWATYANEPPAGQLRLASPATINFTVDLLSAVAEMFPSTLFSTGGDEINMPCYQNDTETQKDLGGRTIAQALGAFTEATHGALRNLGKTPVVWEGT